MVLYLTVDTIEIYILYLWNRIQFDVCSLIKCMIFSSIQCFENQIGPADSTGQTVNLLSLPFDSLPVLTFHKNRSKPQKIGRTVQLGLNHEPRFFIFPIFLKNFEPKVLNIITLISRIFCFQP